MHYLQLFAGIIAAISVLMSAWLSHATNKLSFTQVDNAKTALLFAFLHCLAIFVCGILQHLNHHQTQQRLLLCAGCLFALGLVSFSGVILLKTFVSIGAWSKLTPIGGMAFTMGWLILGVASMKTTGKKI